MERIQNPVLWQSFAVKRNVIDQSTDARNNKGKKTKMWLFHGTSIDTGEYCMHVAAAASLHQLAAPIMYCQI